MTTRRDTAVHACQVRKWNVSLNEFVSLTDQRDVTEGG